MSLDSNVEVTKCLYVEQDTDSGRAVRSIREFPLGKLDDEFVRIRVDYSSLNYKDALCATGHPGIARKLPIIPGIDAAGVVIDSNTKAFNADDRVMVFHAAFGTSENGGMSQVADVPSQWVYKIPESLNSRTAMILGTAGFTAAQCIDELEKHQITPESGEIIVTGATGGVGIVAVALLSKLGYSVVASSGKPDRYNWLKELGAKEVIGRESLIDETDRPLLSGRWAGAVDTVGGKTLASICRSTKPQGCVTACGLVGGTELEMSVYPFILRGITLQGVDTAGISPEYRSQIWQKISTEWMIDRLEDLAIEVSLEKLDSKIDEILTGNVAGRVIVSMND